MADPRLLGTALVGPDGLLRFGRHTMRASLGRAGVTRHKVEGDGATPSGLLPLRCVLYRADRIARPVLGSQGVRMLVEPIAPEDGWCDDSDHRDYNTAVRLPHEGRHEALWRRDSLYDLVCVLGWNDRPVERRSGSAIFLHIAAPGGAPTEGCIAVALPDLVQLLAEGLTAVEVVT